jgi:GTP-binding protein Era
VDRIEHGPNLTRIAATLHVEKPGQRKILVGHAGAAIREIGTASRQRIEELLDRHAHLELFVRVTPRWRNAPRQLAELGYTPPDEP